MASYRYLIVVFLLVLASVIAYAKSDASAGGWVGSSGTGWSSSPAGSFGGSSASGWGSNLGKNNRTARANSGYDKEKSEGYLKTRFTGWIMNE